MVFKHVLDSVVVSAPERDGNQPEEIKTTGPQLSLKDLVSPFGLSKGRFAGSHAIRNSPSLPCGQCNASSQKSSTSRVIVGPEHNFVRRREYSKESSMLRVQRSDTTKSLPSQGTKFRQPEYSDTRPHGLRETPLANESLPDSSSEIQTAPFSHEPLFPLRNKEATSSASSIKQQTNHNNIHNTGNHTQSPIMSSPKCYKQLNRRSRSIAIKSPQPLPHVSHADAMAAEEDSASTERMYDWATWRMYNRIVDHRRNQRMSSPSLAQPEATITSTAMTLPHTTQDDYDHGEVFEMEM